MPPTPTQATFTVSLGALRWGVWPTTCRGTTMNPAAAVEAAPRNFLRLQDGSEGEGVFFVSSIGAPSLSVRFEGDADRGAGGRMGKKVHVRRIFDRGGNELCRHEPAVRCHRRLYHKGAERGNRTRGGGGQGPGEKKKGWPRRPSLSNPCGPGSEAVAQSH